MQERGEQSSKSEGATAADADCVRGPFLRLRTPVNPARPMWMRASAIQAFAELEPKASNERAYTEIYAGPITARATADAETIAALIAEAEGQLEERIAKALGNAPSARDAQAQDVEEAKDDRLAGEWRSLLDAGEKLADALGEKDRFSSDEDATAATIFCINEAIDRLSRCAWTVAAARGRYNALLSAAHPVLQTLGFVLGADAPGSDEEHAEIISLMNQASKRWLELADRAATSTAALDDLSRQNSELDARLATMRLGRKTAEAQTAHEVKTNRVLQQRLDDALRQLPKAVQDDLAKVWVIREAAGVQS